MAGYGLAELFEQKMAPFRMDIWAFAHAKPGCLWGLCRALEKPVENRER